MGAADVVPGVSGGTVAFITGIYEELLASIRSITPQLLGVLFREGIGAAWRQVNGTFLVLLVLGILTSVLSLARLITYWLEYHPLLVWSFFFGLIVASCWHMARQLSGWSVGAAIAVLVGAGLAWAVGELKPSQVSPDLVWVFGSGAIAICAMILPGISGSFILVLLGMYAHVLTAVKELNLLLLGTFAAGCGIGLLAFAHVLSWLFRRFHDLTMALLTGFLVGSLNLVWPWKQTLSYYQNSKGEQLALEQDNVLPATYSSLTGEDSQLVFCVGLALFGVVLVLLLEKFGAKAAEK